MKFLYWLLFLPLLLACNGDIDLQPTVSNPDPPETIDTTELPKKLSYLALGDSYTIGHGVPSEENFPNQLATRLTANGDTIQPIKIIAQTGWTSFRLQVEINNATDPDSVYDIVTLLIGVNDQYQGQPIAQYPSSFETLLEKAIQFAGGRKERVFVVSIPDYAFTGFGGGDPDISIEIDEYNAINKRIAEEMEVTYFDITPISRKGLDEPELVASDRLHPSGEQYRRWVDLMFPVVLERLQ